VQVVRAHANNPKQQKISHKILSESLVYRFLDSGTSAMLSATLGMACEILELAEQLDAQVRISICPR
jgi:hypothetical protein